MNTHKWKNEERPMTAHKPYLTIGILFLMVIVAAAIWNQDAGLASAPVDQVDGFFDTIFGFVGDAIGAVFGLIGGIIGLVFGLIGHIIGLVFGIVGVILGVVGTVIGLVFGFVGLILGLVFGTLGLVFSVVIPLAIIVMAVKVLGTNNAPRDEKQKRKREWNDDIVDV